MIWFYRLSKFSLIPSSPALILTLRKKNFNLGGNWIIDQKTMISWETMNRLAKKSLWSHELFPLRFLPNDALGFLCWLWRSWEKPPLLRDDGEATVDINSMERETKVTICFLSLLCSVNQPNEISLESLTNQMAAGYPVVVYGSLQRASWGCCLLKRK